MAITIGINASFLRKPDTGIGQVTQHVLNTLAQFQREHPLGKDLRIIVYLEQALLQHYPWHDQFIVRTFLPRYQRDDLIRKVWWEKQLLPKEVKKDRCDMFLSLYHATTILPSSIRHVMVVHDTIWRIFPEYVNNFRKRIYYQWVEKAIQRADGIITVSDHSRKDVLHFIFGIDDAVNIKGFEDIRRKVIFSHIDCDPLFKQPFTANSGQIMARYGIDAGERYLFYVGGFEVRKNVEGLLQAYGLLYQQLKKKTQFFPGMKQQDALPALVLAGTFHAHLVPSVTDIFRVIEAVTQAYDIPPDKIKMIGFVPQKDLPALYHRAAAFCYLSRYEGFGLPPLEALHMGCPVILSAATSLGEIFPSTTVLQVDPTDTKQIVQAMIKVLTDPTVAESLKTKGKAHAQRFNWIFFVDDILEQLLQRPIDWAKPSLPTHE